MLFAPRYSRSECALVGRLRRLGAEDERTVRLRPEIREALRERLVSEARGRAA